MNKKPAKTTQTQPVQRCVIPAPNLQTICFTLVGTAPLVINRFSEKAKTVKYDADQFNASDIANLLKRVGEQVGVGEVRHDGRSGCGVGWGTFTIE